jgi:hypothetical protein
VLVKLNKRVGSNFMVIDITRQVEVLFNLFVLALGLDFLVTGFCVLRDKNIKHTPKFIGFLFLRRVEIIEKEYAGKKYSNNPLTRLARIMFTLKFFGYDFVIGGLLIIMASLLMLLSITVL